MRCFKSFLLCVCFLFGACTSLFSQEKYEAESRLSERDVPELALRFIDTLPLKKRVKWYLEEGLTQHSIEAKYLFNGQKYSVEFDTAGVIQDVEVEIKWNELNQATREEITQFLSTEFSDFNIVKTQVQYVGDRSTLLSKLLNETPTAFIQPNYELVVKCKKGKKTALFEFLFSAEGKLISRAQIVLKPSAHLEY